MNDRKPKFRHVATDNQARHAPGHYTPDVRELEPARDSSDDWHTEAARAGAEQLLHTAHLP